MGSKKAVEEAKHAAGGPGKPSKEGHIDPDKGNKPGQKQSPTRDGPGGESGSRGVPEDKHRGSG